MFSCPFVPELTEFLASSVFDVRYSEASSLIGSFFLVLFAGFAFIKTIFGHPMECLIPQDFSVEWGQYVEEVCLSGNTYFWPVVWNGPNGTMKQPFTEEEKQANSTVFYAHIHIAFAVCALLSLATKFVSQILLKTTRVPLERLATKAEELEAEKCTKTMRTEEVNNMVDLFYEGIVNRKKKFGWWDVQTVLIISKALYHFSTVLQLCLLSSFLRFDDMLWGWTLTYNNWIGRTWLETGMFPRIVFCDVEMAVAGAEWIQDHVQCHLGVSDIYEMFCMLLWWWYSILAVFTLTGFLMELLNCYSIEPLKSTMRGKKEKLREFAEFLTPDGVLVLRFLHQISDSVTNEMAVKLWEKYENGDWDVEEETNCLPESIV